MGGVLTRVSRNPKVPKVVLSLRSSPCAYKQDSEPGVGSDTGAKYLTETGVCSRNKKLSGGGVPPMEKKKLSLERTTCLADKTNHPVERLSLNRSQCGSCSTKYDTSAGT